VECCAAAFDLLWANKLGIVSSISIVDANLLWQIDTLIFGKKKGPGEEPL